MTSIGKLPDGDPTKIFFHLEDDIRSIVDYVVLLRSIIESRDAISDECSDGLFRLAGVIHGHAASVQEGFREAFQPSKAE